VVIHTSRSFPHSWLSIGFVPRLTRRVALVEQDLLTLPEHLSLPPIFSWVRVTRSLVLCVCFVDRRLSFCPFSFGHCVVCSSSIYGSWLPLWHLQALLIISTCLVRYSYMHLCFFTLKCNFKQLEVVWTGRILNLKRITCFFTALQRTETSDH